MYAGSDDGKVYAVNVATGATLWTATTGGKIVGPPSLGPGIVVVGSTDGKVYELDATTGAVRWAVDMKAPISGGATLAGTTIYVGVDPGVMHALSATNGAERWNKDIAAGVGTAPAVSGGAVLVGGDRKRLFSLSSAGQRNWVFDTLGPVASPVTPVAGTVYVGTTDGDLVALVESTGIVRWRHTIGFPVGPVTVGNGVIYAGAANRPVLRLRPRHRRRALERGDRWPGGRGCGGLGGKRLRRQRRPVPPRRRRRDRCRALEVLRRRRHPGHACGR